MTEVIPIKIAYAAMFAFIEDEHRQTNSDELGALLGSMSLLNDGSTVDPAVWSAWLAAVERAESGSVDLTFRFGKRN
jgi:hypothetical protein